MRARTGGAWQEVETGRVYVDGAWRELTEARAYISGQWETIAQFVSPLSLSLSQSTMSATRVGDGFVTTLPNTATPSGGRAPYSYVWTRIVGTGGSALSPSSATTRFTRFVFNDTSATETFRCTATDNFGTTATADVDVTFESFDEFPA